MTIYTNGDVKIIGLKPMEQKPENASAANNTSHLTNSLNVRQAPIKDIAESVKQNTCENGENAILIIVGTLYVENRERVSADWSHEIAERLATNDPVHYCPKAAKSERSKGLDDFYWRKDKESPIGFVRITREEWEALGEEEKRIKAETGKRVSLRAQGNIHVTVKPISLLIWLCRLLSSPKEYAPRRILIPFLGSGSEMIGAILSGGFEEVVGVEIHKDYADIAEARVKFWLDKPKQMELI